MDKKMEAMAVPLVIAVIVGLFLGVFITQSGIMGKGFSLGSGSNTVSSGDESTHCVDPTMKQGMLSCIGTCIDKYSCENKPVPKLFSSVLVNIKDTKGQFITTESFDVSLFDAKTSKAVKSGKSSAGKITFEEVEPGVYYVQVNANVDYDSFVSKPFSTTAGKISTVNAVLQSKWSEVLVNIKDAKGKVITTSSFDVSLLNANTKQIVKTGKSSEGKATFGKLAPGSYVVKVSPSMVSLGTELYGSFTSQPFSTTAGKTSTVNTAIPINWSKVVVEIKDESGQSITAGSFNVSLFDAKTSKAVKSGKSSKGKITFEEVNPGLSYYVTIDATTSYKAFKSPNFSTTSKQTNTVYASLTKKTITSPGGVTGGTNTGGSTSGGGTTSSG